MSRLRNLDLVLIRTFVTVAQTGSISAAARQLHLTQGGISQQIKRLEVFFNCLLLERDARGTQLTERGIQLLPKARQLLDLNDNLCNEMIGSAISETVRVGVPYDMAGAHFAPVLKTYAERHPGVAISIVTGSSVDLMQAFANGHVDLTLSQTPASQSSGERLYVEPLVWIGTPGELHRQRPLPLCFVTSTCTFRSTAFALLSEAQITWRVVFENASVDTTLSTVRSELAVTPWLRSLIPDGLHELGAESGLPPLPDFAVGLHVADRAGEGVLAMAQVIRWHYDQAGQSWAPSNTVANNASSPIGLAK
ncbi:LysR substrate-binding domain-containing protein [Pseudomonas sp. SZMC_28357]|uniref:LysR family transcriptional regulator n=1 Tax=Pseudomonas sp. SZMC_28357 TaxID=3074380 RepID=UPI0028712416|nr:LysR substrate-binding domain-containing protein [Pseudomonas sp. SZMC_28357]MDR9753601.1 LysR substrate-binding domain-containing protein [Pseudomonas sp. SZMC_28357]